MNRVPEVLGVMFLVTAFVTIASAAEIDTGLTDTEIQSGNWIVNTTVVDQTVYRIDSEICFGSDPGDLPFCDDVTAYETDDLQWQMKAHDMFPIWECSGTLYAKGSHDVSDPSGDDDLNTTDDAPCSGGGAN